jgi:hypothetical protein
MRCGAALSRCVLVGEAGLGLVQKRAGLENRHCELIICARGRLGERWRNGSWNLDISTGNAILRPKPRTDMATLQHPPHVLVLATGVAMSPVGGPTGAVSLVAPPR